MMSQPGFGSVTSPSTPQVNHGGNAQPSHHASKKRLTVETLTFVLASTLHLFSSSSSSPFLPTHMQLHPTYRPNIHTYTHPEPPRQWQAGGGGRWEAYKRVRDYRGRAEETSPSLTTASCTFSGSLHSGRSERLTHSLARSRALFSPPTLREAPVAAAPLRHLCTPVTAACSSWWF